MPSPGSPAREAGGEAGAAALGANSRPTEGRAAAVGAAPADADADKADAAEEEDEHARLVRPPSRGASARSRASFRGSSRSTCHMRKVVFYSHSIYSLPWELAQHRDDRAAAGPLRRAPVHRGVARGVVH